MRHQAETVETLVERELGARRWGLAFPRELERRFETETGPTRSRLLFINGIVGLAVYLAYGFADFWLTPDVAVLATVLRWGIVGSLSLIALVLFWFNPRPVLRESLVAFVCTLAGLVTLAVMLMSTSPLRDLHADVTVLMMLFVAVVQRARFPYAVAGCLALLVAHAIALLAMPDYPQVRLIDSVMLLLAATMLIAMASYSLEREFRRAYLLQLRERLANSTLSDISQHDPMTGLGNRRALDLAFAAIARDGNPGEDVAVVLLDIDHFKAYNDTLGHMAGDEALRQVANTLRTGLRAGSDRAFRFGGEEFLLLLRRTPLSEAVGLAERLRRRIEGAAIPHPKAAGRVLTASFGVAAARTGGGIDSDELVAGADAALYAAKRSGRNQVWPPLPATRVDDRPLDAEGARDVS